MSKWLCCLVFLHILPSVRSSEGNMVKWTDSKMSESSAALSSKYVVMPFCELRFLLFHYWRFTNAKLIFDLTWMEFCTVTCHSVFYNQLISLLFPPVWVHFTATGSTTSVPVKRVLSWVLWREPREISRHSLWLVSPSRYMWPPCSLMHLLHPSNHQTLLYPQYLADKFTLSIMQLKVFVHIFWLWFKVNMKWHDEKLSIVPAVCFHKI